LLRELAGGFETVACLIAFDFLFYFKLTTKLSCRKKLSDDRSGAFYGQMQRLVS
jgi:hypothetical protein